MCDAYAEYATARHAKELAYANASLSRIQARDALVRGEEATQELRREASLLVGAQRAAYAGQNVEVGVGSAADMEADTARRAEENVLRIRANAAREAWGYKMDAAFEVYRGKMEYRAGMTRAITSALGTAATFAGSLKIPKSKTQAKIQQQKNELAMSRSLLPPRYNIPSPELTYRPWLGSR